MKTLIIIPAYNEEQNISSVINDIRINLEGVDYVVINDCSNDNTVRILKEIGANYINLPVNLGIGGGMQTGYLYAFANEYDIAIQMDGDGQHDSEYITKLIKPIEEGNADVVIGSRYITKEGFQSTKLRRLGISLLSNIIKSVCGVKVVDVTSGFRAVNKELIKIYSEEYAQDYPEPEAIVLAAMHNLRIVEIPVIMHQRKGGVSSISSFKSIYYMIKVSIAIILNRLIFDRKRR